jgi:glycosyl transferase family 25
MQSLNINLQIERFDNALPNNIQLYVINLDRNQERYANFVENCKNVMNNVQVERFSAVDGNDISYKELEDIVAPHILQGINDIDRTHKRISDEQMTRGMVGCYLSHIRIYEQNFDKSNIVFIFEDDGKFDANVFDIAMNFKDIPDDWDIILLGTVRIFSYIQHSESWKRVYDFWGTQGYIINDKGMKKMLQYYKPMQNQIDFKMGELSKNNLLNVYAYKDNLVYQCSSFSDVQMSVAKAN